MSLGVNGQLDGQTDRWTDGSHGGGSSPCGCDCHAWARNRPLFQAAWNIEGCHLPLPRLQRAGWKITPSRVTEEGPEARETETSSGPHRAGSRFAWSQDSPQLPPRGPRLCSPVLGSGPTAWPQGQDWGRGSCLEPGGQQHSHGPPLPSTSQPFLARQRPAGAERLWCLPGGRLAPAGCQQWELAVGLCHWGLQIRLAAASPGTAVRKKRSCGLWACCPHHGHELYSQVWDGPTSLWGRGQPSPLCGPRVPPVRPMF